MAHAPDTHPIPAFWRSNAQYSNEMCSCWTFWLHTAQWKREKNVWVASYCFVCWGFQACVAVLRSQSSRDFCHPIGIRRHFLVTFNGLVCDWFCSASISIWQFVPIYVCQAVTRPNFRNQFARASTVAQLAQIRRKVQHYLHATNECMALALKTCGTKSHYVISGSLRQVVISGEKSWMSWSDRLHARQRDKTAISEANAWRSRRWLDNDTSNDGELLLGHDCRTKTFNKHSLR